MLIKYLHVHVYMWTVAILVLHPVLFSSFWLDDVCCSIKAPNWASNPGIGLEGSNTCGWSQPAATTLLSFLRKTASAPDGRPQNVRNLVALNRISKMTIGLGFAVVSSQLTSRGQPFWVKPIETLKVLNLVCEKYRRLRLRQPSCFSLVWLC